MRGAVLHRPEPKVATQLDPLSDLPMAEQGRSLPASQTGLIREVFGRNGFELTDDWVGYVLAEVRYAVWAETGAISGAAFDARFAQYVSTTLAETPSAEARCVICAGVTVIAAPRCEAHPGVAAIRRATWGPAKRARFAPKAQGRCRSSREAHGFHLRARELSTPQR
jgi:hypothetical protein